MEKLRIEFEKIIQDSQDYGSDDDHMVSRIFFSINKQQYHCDVRQPFGSATGSFETDPIEVETPTELKGRIHYGEFRDAVEHYYRSFFGSQGKGIRFGGGHVRMRHNTVHKKEVAVISSAGNTNTGW